MKRTASSLTFIVPGLLDLVPYLDELPVQDLPELATFSKMLSRGNFIIPEHVNNRLDNLYSCVLKEFTAVNAFVQNEQVTPIASLTFLSDMMSLSNTDHTNPNISFDQASLKSQNISLENKWIMRADPSFMVADRDQLVLARTGQLDISIEEAQILTDEINSFFEEYDEEQFWTLRAVCPERWYIISEKAINIPSVPPESALGQSVKPFLFSNRKLKESINQVQNVNNDDISHWLTLFNEFQMILHQSEVNKARIQDKKTPINSLWLWGPGKGIESSSFTTEKELKTLIYSNNSYIKSLGQLINGRSFDLPVKYGVDSDSDTQKIIYAIDDFRQAINNKDIFTWVGLLEQFEKNYLVPIIAAIEDGSINKVEFISPSGRSLLINKKLLKRWWKKSQTYHSLLSIGKHCIK